MSTLHVSFTPSALTWQGPLGQRDVLAVCRRLFVIWLIFRTTLWTLVASTQPNPPLDVVEWLAWGNQWELGYHKHPPLAAWIADLAYRATPASFVGIYLVSYLSIGVALWATWSLARRLVPPRTALAATVCLDGLIFLGQGAAEFNNQVLLIAFWALAIERFHAAVLDDRLVDWVVTGLALGLASLCKYSTAMLILPLLAWWLLHQGLRRWTRPLLVASIVAVVFLPHLLWLIQHDFPTLRYAVQRGSERNDSLMDAWASGFTFLLAQGARLLPVLLILVPTLRPSWRTVGGDRAISRSLLTMAVLGPVALHLVAAVLGVHLNNVWGAPLWTFVGLLVVAHFKTVDSGRSWSRLRLLWAVVLTTSVLLAILANVRGSSLLARPMRVHYPGEQLARELISRYRTLYGVDPAVVAGDWWLAGNVVCHASPRPELFGSREPSRVGLDLRREKGDVRRYLAPDPITCPWTDDHELRSRGGILIWDASVYGEDLPIWLHERFPEAQGQRAVTPRFLGGSEDKLCVGWATIPPNR